MGRYVGIISKYICKGINNVVINLFYFKKMYNLFYFIMFYGNDVGVFQPQKRGGDSSLGEGKGDKNRINIGFYEQKLSHQRIFVLRFSSFYR